MFTLLFTSIFEFVLFIVALVVVYQIFLSDWLSVMKSNKKSLKDKAKSAEKLAKISLTFTDIQAVENFVQQNAQYLSDDMINQIAAHLEDLHAQEAIVQHDQDLKNQIDEVSKQAQGGRVAITPLSEALSLPAVDDDAEKLDIQGRHNLV